MIVILYLMGISSIIEGVVLDPALYLAPNPPLSTSRDNDAEKIWSELNHSQMNKKKSKQFLNERSEYVTSDQPDALEVSETFWPSYRSLGIKGIYVPLSFHLSGTYGGSSSGVGTYSSGYVGIPDTYENAGKAVLAGTKYKSAGVYSGLRVFGGNSKPSWSGWGNGKWGHYGKG